MIEVESHLEAVPRTVDGVVASSTAFGIPPSEVDPATFLMRFVWNGVVISRAFDPAMVQ